MTTLNLKVEDNLVDVIKTMLVGFVQDKISTVKKFEKNLNEKFQLLKSNPLMCRKSYYFEDESYRDI